MWSYLFPKKVVSNNRPKKVISNNPLKKLFNDRPLMVAGPTLRGSHNKSTTKINTRICPGLKLHITQNTTCNPIVIRNKNASSLDSGVYLFLIQYNVDTEKFSIRFSPVQSRQELRSRHLFMPNYSVPHRNFVVASGELEKDLNGKIKFNLLSGTFMAPLMSIYTRVLSQNVAEKEVLELIKSFLGHNSNKTNKELIPQINTPMKNIMNMRKKGLLKVEGDKRQLKRAHVENKNIENLINLMSTRGIQTRSKKRRLH